MADVTLAVWPGGATIPITEEWIALGDACGYDLRQADIITFAMPPIVATKFPTPVSIIAAPVAKGLYIKTTIAAGYHSNKTIPRAIDDLGLSILFTTRPTVYRTVPLCLINLFVKKVFGWSLTSISFHTLTRRQWDCFLLNGSITIRPTRIGPRLKSVIL